MKFLIAMLIGGIIGYLTNYIAIKMLFRPYEEKRFLGIKIPFTPGLIPKEKSRIAKSVGEVIGEHLLSTETIVNSLCSESINNKLKTWIRQRVHILITSKDTLEKKIRNILGEKYNSFILGLKENLNNLVILNLRNNDNKIKEFIKEKLSKILSDNPDKIINNNIYKELKKQLTNMLEGYINSDEFILVINNLIINKVNEGKIKQKTLGDLLPKSFTGNIKVYIYSKRDNIVNYIKSSLKEEKNYNKLKKILKNVISNNVNSLMSMFIDVDSMTDKIVVFLENYLEEEETKDNLMEIINTNIDKLFLVTIEDITNNLPENSKQSLIEEVSNVITREIKHINITNKLNDKIDDCIMRGDLFRSMTFKSNLYDLINKNIEKFIYSEKLENMVNSLINDMIDAFMNTSIKGFTEGNEEGILAVVYDIAQNNYKRFVENQAGVVIDVLNISKIVEDKINEFDVEVAEEIILQIASKELKAITSLGGLLGAIIGILSPLLGSIY
ncbi:DUF445 family protein [Clostridium niameyense]|uniref:DUF445 family protein n=1 Tax=Clostridium niameyense TaxID=1622073 RepID=UPI00067F1A63|nr:DUF445 family protein [Clostridium niameyense]